MKNSKCFYLTVDMIHLQIHCSKFHQSCFALLSAVGLQGDEAKNIFEFWSPARSILEQCTCVTSCLLLAYLCKGVSLRLQKEHTDDQVCYSLAHRRRFGMKMNYGSTCRDARSNLNCFKIRVHCYLVRKNQAYDLAMLLGGVI